MCVLFRKLCARTRKYYLSLYALIITQKKPNNLNE